MHTKLINNRMQELKRHQTLTHPPTSIDVEDKENILINRYEKEQSEKKNKKKYLQQAEELIMNERLKEIVADNVQYFRNIRNFLFNLSRSQVGLQAQLAYTQAPRQDGAHSLSIRLSEKETIPIPKLIDRYAKKPF